MCFFNRGNTEGTNSSKILFDVCAFVVVVVVVGLFAFFCCCFFFWGGCLFFYRFVSGLILWILDNLWFDDLRAE